MTKDYIVVTFLSVLDLVRKQEVNVRQDNIFGQITISLRGSETNE